MSGDWLQDRINANFELNKSIIQKANSGMDIMKARSGSFDDDDDVLLKGKAATIGEVRDWNGKKYKKQGNGKWMEVSEHGKTKKEHDDKSKQYKENQKRGETLRTYGEVARRSDSIDEVNHKLTASKLSDKEHEDHEVGVGSKSDKNFIQGVDFGGRDLNSWKEQVNKMNLNISSPTTLRSGEPNKNDWFVAKDINGNIKGEFHEVGVEKKWTNDKNPMTIVSNIKEGKYNTGSDEHAALSHYRKTDPYKLTSLDKPVSYKKDSDEWTVGNSKSEDNKEGKQFHSKGDIVNFLTSKGNNPEDSKKMVNKHYDYVKRTYSDSSLKKIAEVIRTIY